VLKGLIIAKKYEHVYVKLRLSDNLDHFAREKGNLKDNAQILIAYHWRKKLNWIREKNKKPLTPKAVEVKKGV
jgi:hypothetical protein